MFDWFKRKSENNKVSHTERVYTPHQEEKPKDSKVFYREVIPVTLRPESLASSAILKDEFCCKDGERKAKLVQTNHNSVLYGCPSRRCEKILFKFSLGAYMD